MIKKINLYKTLLENPDNSATIVVNATTQLLLMQARILLVSDRIFELVGTSYNTHE